MSFEKFGLRAELLRAVAAEGYKVPTPIQDRAIPAILKRKDVLAGAQTGTGKTAAFGLPVLQLLDRTRGKGCSPRCLVLAPTRELAAQVHANIESLGRGLSLKSTVVFGGVGINPQIDRLRRGVDIMVATPGRLLDHAGRKTLDLSRVEILVLDEADRMLDMGFIHDIRKVLKLLPKRRQNMLFSATYSTDIKRLADSLLNSPEIIEVSASNKAADGVSQTVYPVARTQKRQLLSTLIRTGEWNKVLVFTRTKHGANRLTKQLIQDGIGAAAIHGNKSQTARTRALADFKSEKIRTLVATDIAARGLDIDMLPHVVNFDLPNVPEDYVHRIGRTGRAGATGMALSLVCRDEQKQLKDIQRLLKHDIPVTMMDGFELEKAGATPRPAARPRTNSRRKGYQGRSNAPRARR
ncbi:ATP-dependent RNA helicase RhlE [Desulfocicer vacuolatum DSM 3385]|uniref:DEAD-box ATP-dependent RNA helicase RhpA n=1 Tax=Desulfocicer vacuolatum DSM 3385 TaxID=1121400 RepID=A0A1W2EEC4_9BACT|nr:DEAD/DEAH box helicase [Desulfocicer vacuolatum]SMD08110.1 ATP-dependent RNA helicase RhlE [Desulfocicer vacuolatum DSM 3385]